MTGLVGGATAINYDFEQAVESDFRLIAPLALLVIFIILACCCGRWWPRWS